MSRKSLAAVILFLWVVGLGWMLRRNLGSDVTRRLTEAAVRIEPARYYYDVSYRGQKIGAASSAIDTLVKGLESDDYFTGRFPSGDSLLTVSARMQTRLTRGLRLKALSIDLDLGRKTLISARVDADSVLLVTRREFGRPAVTREIALDSPLITPTLIGIPLILGDRPKLGRSERLAVFDPVSSSVASHDLEIVAESVFTVVDSAARSDSGVWYAAHSDTVRGWRVGGGTRGLIVWLDGEGRILEASAPNGVALRRTAYELAFDKARDK